MAITKAKKETIVAKLTDALAGATAAVFVRFNKLTVADISRVRKQLKKEGVEYYVVSESEITLVVTK